MKRKTEFKFKHYNGEVYKVSRRLTNEVYVSENPDVVISDRLTRGY